MLPMCRRPWRRSWTLAVAAGALVVGVPVSPAFGAKQPQTVFLCTNLVSGASWLIKINFDDSTVDSNPARISDTEISWHGASDGGNYTLDRKTGNLTVIVPSSTGGYFIHDRCRPRS